MYGLRLHAREEYTVAAPDFGNVVHQILQNMDEIIKARHTTWQKLERSESDELV